MSQSATFPFLFDSWFVFRSTIFSPFFHFLFQFSVILYHMRMWVWVCVHEHTFDRVNAEHCMQSCISFSYASCAAMAAFFYFFSCFLRAFSFLLCLLPSCDCTLLVMWYERITVCSIGNFVTKNCTTTSANETTEKVTTTKLERSNTCEHTVNSDNVCIDDLKMETIIWKTYRILRVK